MVTRGAGREYPTVLAYVAVCLGGLLLRAATGLHPYSGEHTPPMYGDFEAQRHWMEISLALPPAEWYRNSSVNDLSYWGLDYPPVSGYGSMLAGWMMRRVEPTSVELFVSRGHESARSRAGMRATVLIADALLFFPALCLFFMYSEQARIHGHEVALSSLVFATCTPALIIVDHGHFQYNGVSLGLFVAALHCFQVDKHAIGAAAFALSVYYKQMNLYYAPAIAAYLLGTMVKQLSFSFAIRYGIKVCLAVLCTTALVFWPWRQPTDAVQVLHRLFPVSRGLYEDKVANVWCTLSVVVKLGRLLSRSQLVAMCAVSTAAGCLPFSYIVACRPNIRTLVWSCAGCALSAYLFSYHVHEKQILIPLMPFTLLFAEMPRIVLSLSCIALMSMYPLLSRERLHVPYAALALLHVLVADSLLLPARKDWSVRRPLSVALGALVALIHALFEFGPEVPSKPDLYTVVLTSLCCAYFCFVYLALLWQGLGTSWLTAQTPLGYGKRQDPVLT